METFSPRDWLQNFRLSKDTFDHLCAELTPHIQYQDTRLRDAITVKKRVAITLWTLSSPAEYRTVSHLFGVGRSTVCEVVHETCKAIVDHLLPKYICFPSIEQQQQYIDNFESKWGVPQCLGAIDGSHIPISPPALCHTDYYNRKGWYSVLVQAVVDYKFCFLDIYTGWPGSVHDARVLAHSTFYKKATVGQLLSRATKPINGVNVPVFVIGDSAYPMQPWLMKPYNQPSIESADKRTYNYRICRGRIVVEIAFGRLKARWRRLLKRNDMLVKNVPNIVASECVLHNMCEIHGEAIDESWLNDNHPDLPQPDRRPHSAVAGGSTAIRDALVHHFNS